MRIRKILIRMLFSCIPAPLDAGPWVQDPRSPTSQCPAGKLGQLGVSSLGCLAPGLGWAPRPLHPALQTLDQTLDPEGGDNTPLEGHALAQAALEL